MRDRMPDRAADLASTAGPRLRQLLLSVVLVPLGLMLCVAVLLTVQIAHLLRDSGMVAHSDEVLSQANHVQKLTVDLETGLRGFLVTGDASFLEPYERALAVIDAQSAELYRRAAERPDQQARVADLDRRRGEWLAYARDQIARRRAGRDYAAVAREGYGKGLMDGMRSTFDDLLRVEEGLRAERFDDARRASRATFLLVGLIGVVGGGLLSLSARHQIGEITRTYDAAIVAARDANVRLEQRVAERTAELNDANVRLGEVNKELEAFAYSISHDLRAPMRHIAGFANLLRTSLGPTLSTDDLENLTTIGDTAKLAGRMVDDLLGFSRVGRVSVAVSTVDVVEIVEACRHELGPDTAGRDVRWIVHPIPPVRADPALLRMAVRNLLANAVKYTARRPSASINVGPAPWPPAAGPAVGCGPDAVTFAVTDNGVGFDMAYAAKLFGVFQRLHRAEDFDGTGIGLANVKRIIGRLGGGVWGEGVPDGGATFYVCLPAAAPTVEARS
jgi:signal transduction histidine kinase